MTQPALDIGLFRLGVMQGIADSLETHGPHRLWQDRMHVLYAVFPHSQGGVAYDVSLSDHEIHMNRMGPQDLLFTAGERAGADMIEFMTNECAWASALRKTRWYKARCKVLAWTTWIKERPRWVKETVYDPWIKIDTDETTTERSAYARIIQHIKHVANQLRIVWYAGDSGEKQN
jgi:hypothetical protein